MVLHEASVFEIIDIVFQVHDIKFLSVNIALKLQVVVAISKFQADFIDETS
jgi:hypothetical protein